MKGSRSKLFVIAVVFLFIAGACAPVAPAPTPTPAPPAATPVPPTATPVPPSHTAVVQAFVEAFNTGNVDAIMATFIDDVNYRFVYAAYGKKQLRTWFEWVIGIEGKYGPPDCQPQGDGLSCTFSYRDACTVASGAVGGLLLKGAYTFADDGKISAIGGDTYGNDWSPYWSFLQAVGRWASTNRPADFAKDSVSKEFAPIQVKLCQEYAASLKSTPAPPAATTAPPTPEPPSPTPVAQMMEVVRAYAAAINGDDISAFPALFSEPFVNGWMGWSAKKQDELASLYGFYGAQHDGMALAECWQDDDIRVKCNATYWDDCHKAAGIPAMPVSVGFTIVDKKIRMLTFNPAGSDGKAADAKFTDFLINIALWIKQERQAELARLTTDGRGNWIWNAETGAIISRLCPEYAATLRPAAAQIPATTGFAEVNGTRLYYEVAGSGDAVVLVHGFMLSTRMWDDQFGEFAKRYRTIRYDQRNFGRSDKASGAYSSLDDLQALLKFLGVQQAHVIGLSLGGQLALNFAYAHPEMVKSVVAVDSVFGSYATPELGNGLSAAMGLAGSGDLAGGKQKWLQHAAFAPALEQPAVAARMKQMIEEDRWGLLTFVGSNTAPLAALTEIKKPTLVIVGARDLPEVISIADKLTAAIPGAQKVVIPNVGHMSSMEAPAEFNKIVLDFLAGVK